MSLRFLKKLNGEKILQQYDNASMEYKDVPLVSESAKERLMKAVLIEENRGRKLTILISERFHDLLKMEHNGLYSPEVKDITSIYGHEFYITKNMISDYKLLVDAK